PATSLARQALGRASHVHLRLAKISAAEHFWFRDRFVWIIGRSGAGVGLGNTPLLRRTGPGAARTRRCAAQTADRALSVPAHRPGLKFPRPTPAPDSTKS